MARTIINITKTIVYEKPKLFNQGARDTPTECQSLKINSEEQRVIQLQLRFDTLHRLRGLTKGLWSLDGFMIL
jgi:hypothetical protein